MCESRSVMAGESRLSRGLLRLKEKSILKRFPDSEGPVLQALIAIFHEVRDPRDFNARHDLAAMLFIALAATLCGAKTCVDIADFAAANEAELAQIVDLPHGAPSHDSFSRLFRCLLYTSPSPRDA